ncbi:cyclophilin-like fold protein [Vaginella massiliensis]|uniref:cyclophilin-like fold protein n=1 Tax=Vaginella massiliensis TaxID=1816680 RepID=UPI00083896C0|nr:cyclophilin-like fold protein [Vaginella massiliensis]
MDSVQVKITIGEKTAKTILYNHPTCKDFASLLPLTLKLEDYNKLEKISLLSPKISSENAPSGFDPPVANLTDYEPWGNLALFY